MVCFVFKELLFKRLEHPVLTLTVNNPSTPMFNDSKPIKTHCLTISDADIIPVRHEPK